MENVEKNTRFEHSEVKRDAKTKFDRKDVRLQIVNEQYFVDNFRNRVTCQIDYRLKTPWLSYLNFGHLGGSCISVAYCHDDDVFDVEKGKKIALTKAENQAYSQVVPALIARINEQYAFLNTIADIAEDFREKAKNAIEHNKEYIANGGTKTK